MSVNVETSGPIFNGQAQAALQEFLVDVRQTIGQEGVNMVGQALQGVLKHPTGHYQSQIQTTNRGDTNVVDDNGVIYGPWLEGVGSRNKTTRFKGYATFRKTTGKLDRKATQIANDVLQKYIGRMS